MTKHSRPAKKMSDIGFAIFTGVIAFGLALYFFQNSWWGPDDGAYALVAEQILNGKILQKDIQDIHTGYINFANAGVMKIFGRDILVLRYPLLIFFAIEAGIAYLFLRKAYSEGVAVLCALIFPLLSYNLFNNVTANWYGQFLAFILAGIFGGVIPVKNYRTLLIGFIVGLTFMFRQTTGVFIGFAALFLLILEANEKEYAASGLFSRALMAFLVLVFGIYLAAASQLPGLLLFGIWPFLLLAHGAVKANATPAKTIEIIAKLAAGAAAAALPLVLYHICHGSILIWINDIFGASLRMRQSAHFDAASYIDFSFLTFWAIGQKPLLGLLGAIFWNLLLASGAILGAVLISRLKSGAFDNPTKFGIVASFHGVIGLHYEVPIYLIYACGFCWLAILLILDTKRSKQLFTGLTAFLLAFSLFFHSGESVSRGSVQMALAEKTAFTPLEIEGASINVAPVEKELYRKLMNVIENCSGKDDSVFFFPTNAELYFLSRRDLPFRFFSTGLGLHSQEVLSSTLSEFEKETAPVLVINKYNDKYHNDYSRMLAEFIEKNYYYLSAAFEFRVYTKVKAAPGSKCSEAGDELGVLSSRSFKSAD